MRRRKGEKGQKGEKGLKTRLEGDYVGCARRARRCVFLGFRPGLAAQNQSP